MLIFFLIVFSILGLGYAYVGWRLILAPQIPAPWNWVAWGVLVLFLALPALSMAFSMRRVETGWTEVLSYVAYVSLGFVSLLITLTFARDIVWMVSAGIQKVISLTGLGPDEAASIRPPDPERRTFLVRSMGAGIATIAGGLAAYGFYEARRRPAIVEVTVPIERLPAAFDGFRILQITDIHAGLTVKRDFVEMVVDQANGLRADLIAFTGDLVDGSVSRLRDVVAPMENISAPFGKFFITGNHEYYSGVEPWVEEAKRLGFTVLLNEHRVLRKDDAQLVLAGVTDFSGGQFLRHHRSSPEDSLKNAPGNVIKILLAHQPKSIREAARVGFDLQISGHTHGGQFFPWNYAAALDQPFIAGLHQFQNTWIYVSKGTGYWGPPLRLGARSEITVITLRKSRLGE